MTKIAGSHFGMYAGVLGGLPCELKYALQNTLLLVNYT